MSVGHTSFFDMVWKRSNTYLTGEYILHRQVSIYL